MRNTVHEMSNEGMKWQKACFSEKNKYMIGISGKVLFIVI